MKSSEKEKFGESLSVPQATEGQMNIAKEQIKSIAFREMSKFDFTNNKKLNLYELAQRVANQCNISDISKVSDMIEIWLDTGDYILKIDRESAYRQKEDNPENYEIYEIKSIVKQPSTEYTMQMKWQEEKNVEANETLQKFVDKVQVIMETLPRKKRYDVDVIKSRFSASDIEKKSMWIDLAIEKAIQTQKMTTMEKWVK